MIKRLNPSIKISLCHQYMLQNFCLLKLNQLLYHSTIEIFAYLRIKTIMFDIKVEADNSLCISIGIDSPI